ncbi:YxeA family protein [Bacillus bingmayongensis]|uniref:YxeA family protein n=1 Tax=Bacillus bingmayongensis TaxID=1150157 RepID=UPI001C8F1479|nr:YxeA family protein [Bacillus bingmayongensis]MBY0597368.1 YxeA family protein [Bacillus bingmayongensis]
MKRYIALISILALFATMLVGCVSINKMYNRGGKDVYYVQIKNDGEEHKDRFDNGEQYIYYQYKLVGFDKDGKEKELEFRADKNLRKEAFLSVFYSDKRGVTSWEEVKKDDLPAKVKEKLGVK